MPALLGLDHPEALLAGPVEVVRGVAGAAHADLDDPVAVEDPGLDGPPERGAVGDLGAEHDVVDVGVGVDVDEADGSVPLRHGLEDREHDRVVSSHGNSDEPVSEQCGEVGLDGVDSGQQVIGAGRHVADVVDAEAVEWRRPGGHVVGAQQHGLVADAPWSEAGTGSVGGSDVERHADDRHVEVRRVAATGQAHERGDAAESGHLVVAQRLRLPVVVQGASVVQASQSCTGPTGVGETGGWQNADRHGP